MQAKRTTNAAEDSDQEEEYQELPSSRASDARSDGSGSDSESEDGVDDAKDAAVIDEGVSDLDYLKSRMKAGVSQQGSEDKTSSQTSSLTDTGQGTHEPSLLCRMLVLSLGGPARALAPCHLSCDVSQGMTPMKKMQTVASPVMKKRRGRVMVMLMWPQCRMTGRHHMHRPFLRMLTQP